MYAARESPSETAFTTRTGSYGNQCEDTRTRLLNPCSDMSCLTPRSLSHRKSLRASSGKSSGRVDAHRLFGIHSSPYLALPPSSEYRCSHVRVSAALVRTSAGDGSSTVRVYFFTASCALVFLRSPRDCVASQTRSRTSSSAAFARRSRSATGHMSSHAPTIWRGAPPPRSSSSSSSRSRRRGLGAGAGGASSANRAALDASFSRREHGVSSASASATIASRAGGGARWGVEGGGRVVVVVVVVVVAICGGGGGIDGAGRCGGGGGASRAPPPPPPRSRPPFFVSFSSSSSRALHSSSGSLVVVVAGADESAAFVSARPPPPPPPRRPPPPPLALLPPPPPLDFFSKRSTSSSRKLQSSSAMTRARRRLASASDVLVTIEDSIRLF